MEFVIHRLQKWCRKNECLFDEIGHIYEFLPYKDIPPGDIKNHIYKKRKKETIRKYSNGIVVIKHTIDGILHNEDTDSDGNVLPAHTRIENDIHKNTWFYNGIKYCREKIYKYATYIGHDRNYERMELCMNRITKTWLLNETIHSKGDDPAFILYNNGYLLQKKWYKHGKLWRDNLPIVEEYYTNGQLHYQLWYDYKQRQEPSLIVYHKNGTIKSKVWTYNEVPHRIGLPAYEEYDSKGELLQQIWFRRHKMHRNEKNDNNELLPAYIKYNDGKVIAKIWAIDGCFHPMHEPALPPPNMPFNNQLLLCAYGDKYIIWKRNNSFYEESTDHTEMNRIPDHKFLIYYKIATKSSLIEKIRDEMQLIESPLNDNVCFIVKDPLKPFKHLYIRDP